MICRVLYLLVSTFLGSQLAFATEKILPEKEGKEGYSQGAPIPTSSTSCDGQTSITTVINKTPPITVLLYTAPHIQSRIVSYVDLETLLALSRVSKVLYIITETVFQRDGDLQRFIQWPTKSQKLRFIGNLFYKRAFGMYPHLDKRIYYPRPTEPPHLLNILLARKLVNAEFPKGSEILEIIDRLASMRVIEQTAKAAPYYAPTPHRDNTDLKEAFFAGVSPMPE
jgi:hypothetical protein